MKRIILVLMLLACQACLFNRFIPGRNKTTPAVKETPPATATTNPNAADLTDVCRTDVDGISALIDGLEYPQHLYDGDFSRHPEDFDPNQFFTVLTHLHMQEGYALDYVAFQDGMGGRPELYTRLESDPPYATYDDYVAAFANPTPGQEPTPPQTIGRDYLARVQVDGSPESYLEYILMNNYGDQWYLFWHSNYNDAQVICDQSDLDRVNVISSFGEETGLPPEIYSAAKKIDFAPTVAITETGVTVRYVYFTKWGGFIEEVYVLDPESPYLVLSSSSTPLVEYNCGIMF